MENKVKRKTREKYVKAKVEIEKNQDKKIIKPFKKIEKNGTKVGLLSFSEWADGVAKKESPGFSWINHSKIDKIIKESKREVDFLIIQPHAGLENFDYPLPEWKEKYRKFIEQGVDIVIGHHPHVPQGFEIYRNKYIFYSIGNFYFNYIDKKGGSKKGYCLSLEIQNKEIKKIHTIPVIINKRVEIDNSKKARENIKNITKFLESEEYKKEINNKALEMWKKDYSQDYIVAINNINPSYSLLRVIKTLAKWFLRKKPKSQEINFYQTLKNETHYYIIMRALRLILGK